MLLEWQCDEASIRGLFLLAQHSNAGWKLANDVMAKLNKKVCDGEHIRNPSALLHGMTLEKRHVLDGMEP